MNRYMRLFGSDRFPFPVLLFVSYYPILLLLAVSALVSLMAGMKQIAFAAFFILVFLAGIVYYSNPVVRSAGARGFLDLVCMTSLINLSCMLGSILGGLRNRMLYMYPGL